VTYGLRIEAEALTIPKQAQNACIVRFEPFQGVLVPAFSGRSVVLSCIGWIAAILDMSLEGGKEQTTLWGEEVGGSMSIAVLRGCLAEGLKYRVHVFAHFFRSVFTACQS
jgi:hypothetical protein